MGLSDTVHSIGGHGLKWLGSGIEAFSGSPSKIKRQGEELLKTAELMRQGREGSEILYSNPSDKALRTAGDLAVDLPIYGAATAAVPQAAVVRGANLLGKAGRFGKALSQGAKNEMVRDSIANAVVDTLRTGDIKEGARGAALGALIGSTHGRSPIARSLVSGSGAYVLTDGDIGASLLMGALPGVSAAVERRARARSEAKADPKADGEYRRRIAAAESATVDSEANRVRNDLGDAIFGDFSPGDRVRIAGTDFVMQENGSWKTNDGAVVTRGDLAEIARSGKPVPKPTPEAAKPQEKVAEAPKEAVAAEPSGEAVATPEAAPVSVAKESPAVSSPQVAQTPATAISVGSRLSAGRGPAWVVTAIDGENVTLQRFIGGKPNTTTVTMSEAAGMKPPKTKPVKQTAVDDAVEAPKVDAVAEPVAQPPVVRQEPAQPVVAQEQIAQPPVATGGPIRPPVAGQVPVRPPVAQSAQVRPQAAKPVSVEKPKPVVTQDGVTGGPLRPRRNGGSVTRQGAKQSALPDYFENNELLTGIDMDARSKYIRSTDQSWQPMKDWSADYADDHYGALLVSSPEIMTLARRDPRMDPMIERISDFKGTRKDAEDLRKWFRANFLPEEISELMRDMGDPNSNSMAAQSYRELAKTAEETRAAAEKRKARLTRMEPGVSDEIAREQSIATGDAGAVADAEGGTTASDTGVGGTGRANLRVGVKPKTVGALLESIVGKKQGIFRDGKPTTYIVEAIEPDGGIRVLVNGEPMNVPAAEVESFLRDEMHVAVNSEPNPFGRRRQKAEVSEESRIAQEAADAMASEAERELADLEARGIRISGETPEGPTRRRGSVADEDIAALDAEIAAARAEEEALNASLAEKPRPKRSKKKLSASLTPSDVAPRAELRERPRRSVNPNEPRVEGPESPRPEAPLKSTDIVEADGIKIAPDDLSRSERLNIDYIDQQAPLKDLGDDIYRRHRMLAGNDGKVEAAWHKSGVMEGLDRVREEGAYDQFAEILQLERAKEVLESRDPKKVGKIAGLNLEETTAALEQARALLTPSQLQAVEEAQRRIYGLSRELLERARDGGLISSDQFIRMTQEGVNDKYVPLLELEKYLDGDPGGSVIKGFDYETAGPLADPIVSLVRQTARTIDAAEKNAVKLEIVKRLDDPEIARFVQPMNEGVRDYNTRDYGHFDVYVDGNKQSYLTTRPIADALNYYEPQLMNRAMDFIRKTNEILRMGATSHNPAFFLPNVIRDVFTAKFNSPVGLSTIEWLKGIKSAVVRDDVYWGWKAAGGAQSGWRAKHFAAASDVAEKNILKTRPTKNPIKKFIGYLEWLSETSEAATRLGVYRTSLKHGSDATTAAWHSRNATVDFAKAGKKGRYLNQLIPFLNARIQAKANIVETIRRSPTEATIRIAAYGVVPAMLSWAWNVTQFPDEWDKISEFEKEKNLMLVLDSGYDGDRLQSVLKLPTGDMQMFGYATIKALDLLRKDDPRAAERIAWNMIFETLPFEIGNDNGVSLKKIVGSLSPVALRAPIEYALGENLYTELPTTKPYMKDRSMPNERELDTPSAVTLASDVLKHVPVVGKFASPVRIAQAVKTMTGGAGEMFGIRLPSMFIDALTGQETVDARKPLDPISRRFIGADARADQSESFDDIGESRRTVADEKSDDVNAIEHYWRKFVRATSDDDRTDALESLAASRPDLLPEFSARVTRFYQQGMRTGPSKAIASEPVEVRAEYVKRRLARAGDDDEMRTDELAKLAAEGLLTPDVLASMAAR